MKVLNIIEKCMELEDGISMMSMNADDPFDYSVYGQRLRTFNDKNWPTDSAVYIKELVEAGFVYTGEIDLVYCFKCGIKESNWQDNDDPLERHNEANPYCPYVLKKKKIGNETDDVQEQEKSLKSLEDYERESLIYDWVPGEGVVLRTDAKNILEGNANDIKQGNSGLGEKIEQSKPTKPVVNLRLSNEVMRFESKRYQSYAFCSPNKHWPAPEKLSSAGFYFVDDKTGMKCFCCDVIVEGWESAEQCPLRKHSSLSPSCAFAQGIFCGNIPRGQEDVCDSIPLLIQNIQPPSMKAPSHPNYPIDREYLEIGAEHIAPPNLEKEDLFPPSNNSEISEMSNFCQPQRTIIPPRPQLHIEHMPERTVNGFLPPSNRSPQQFDGRSISFGNLLPCFPQSYKVQRAPVEPVLGSPLSPNINLEYSDESKRMKTFFTWPRESPIQPLDLARAGFVYDGKGDLVRCFVCSIYLWGWKQNDNVWLDHQKANPKCPFVQQHFSGAQKENVHPNNVQRNQRIPGELRYPSSLMFPQNHSPLTINQQPASSYAYYDGRTPYTPFFDATDHQRLPGETRNLVSASRPQLYPRPLYSSHSPDLRFDSRLHSEITNGYRLPIHEQQTCNDRLDPPNDSLTEKLKQVRLDNREQNDRIERMVSPIMADSCMKNVSPSNEGIGPPERRPQFNLIPGEIKQLHENNIKRAEQFAERTGYLRRRDDIDRYCKVCMENDVAVTFVPCGHLIVCESCALGVKVCPICRKVITNAVRTYFFGN